ncbi:hypothetical protein FQN57_003117 [Myotisia sp. PD_48]|nr:hypothetical protein FQN57_003117 [Myotisia sp. PD_48]
MAQYSKACCSIPPVVSSGYEKKGQFVTINGMKTYVTGPESATEAILVIYDIFGFFDQTIQGADIIALSDPERKYRVFMPDFFDGEPADISWYPPQTEEHQAKLGNFFGTKAVPQNTLSRIPAVLEEANSKFSPAGTGFKAWGLLGYCWGGKMVALSSGADSSFKAAVQCHPAMMDAQDAEKVAIPMAVLASKDEDAAVVEQYKKNLKVAKFVETWSTMIHGWLAARGDLKDPEVVKEYENGYKVVVQFFHDHM